MIDVLRATTVISTLFTRNCPRVFVAASHDTARTFARANGYLLCGESGGIKVADFDFGNSPVEFDAHEFADRPVVLSTTNGTKATAAVAGARAVFLGAAVNCGAVAAAAWHAATTNDSDIVIVCSGTNDSFTLEDAVVAGIYVEKLVALGGPWTMPSLTDSAIASRRLWMSDSNLLRSWMEGVHAKTLANLGFGEDVAFCSAIDTAVNVPTLVDESRSADVECPVTLVRS